ncbi:HesA/MoeB/ThiF family protein [Sedimentitalea sp. HM32M-2]|uniref:HesA/MoeB/ThiF family protein n=1 Tax=Sedimentitalea sp. HM32M-2 TaxID=3351566 RepID=UPI0036268356
MSRYERQMTLPEIGAAGQDRLASADVLVVGAGGLGSPVLQYLAGAGVGHIALVDPDRVEESNLHRQPLFAMSDVGQAKALAARDRLCAANPDIRVSAHVTALDPANAPALAAQADLVIDAADSYAVSYTLSDLCLSLGTPLVSASVLGQSGYVGGFCGTAPSLRAVFPDLPTGGATCANAGVMGPVVGMIGALQAQMALQILLGHTPSPLGRMVSVDAQSLHFSGFSFLDAPEPDIAFPFLAPVQLTHHDRIIELRTADEAPDPVHAHAIRLTGAKPPEIGPPDPAMRTVLCCSSGLRAWRAAAALAAQGHDNLALCATGRAGE